MQPRFFAHLYGHLFLFFIAPACNRASAIRAKFFYSARNTFCRFFGYAARLIRDG